MANTEPIIYSPFIRMISQNRMCSLWTHSPQTCRLKSSIMLFGIAMWSGSVAASIPCVFNWAIPPSTINHKTSTGCQCWICGTEHGNYVSAGQYQCHGWLCVSSSATKVQGCCWRQEQQKRSVKNSGTSKPLFPSPPPPPNSIVSTNRTCQQNS